MSKGGTTDAMLAWFALRDGYSLATTMTHVALSGPNGVSTFPLDESIRGVVSLLNESRRIQVAAVWGATDSGVDESCTRKLFRWLSKSSGLVRTIDSCSRRVATIESFGEHYEMPEPSTVLPSGSYCLSEQVWIRTMGGEMVLETPLRPVRARMHDPCLVGVLARFAGSAAIEDVLCDIAMNRLVCEAVLVELISEGILLPAVGVPAECGLAKGEGQAVRCWEFHDLLFHTRVRMGRHGAPIGGTYRLKGVVVPKPACKPRMRLNGIPLFRPNLSRLMLQEQSFTAVLESRRTIRAGSAKRLTLMQVGEFLYRVARVRSVYKVEGMEVSNRPYANGGACYELEIYPLVLRCSGLLPGVYHYDPCGHLLEPLQPLDAQCLKMVGDAVSATGGQLLPDVVLIITARFGRVNFKYGSIAYATILKNVGALYTTMYLVATAMGIAPCALGAGDSDRFSAIIDESYYEEGAVGEFAICGR